MIRIGDKVVPYFNMAQEGVVKKINRTPATLWTTTGPVTTKTTVVVLLDKTQQLSEFKLEDLRLVE